MVVVAETDEFYVGEVAHIDATVLVLGAAPIGGLVGTVVTLIIQPPPDDNGVARAEEMPTVSFAPANVAHADYETLYPGWHEWRWVTTGVIKGAQQGRFRVRPINT